MTMEITARDKNLIRLEGDGVSATVRIGHKDATLLYLGIPDTLDENVGKEVLSAIEAAAAASGSQSLMYDFPEDDGISGIFKNGGFEFSQSGEVLSFDSEELLNSEAVKKAMGMNLPAVKSTVFDNLLAFQQEDVVALLKKSAFPIENDDFMRYDPMLSIVSYDDTYQPRAVILTKDWDEGYMVELLLGFSKSKPQYTFCVCQEFARMLGEMAKRGTPGRIFVYSCTAMVKALILRFLDKKYELKKEYPVIHAVKALGPSDMEIPENITEDDPEELWHDEADEIMGRRNISEKSVWYSKRNRLVGKE